MKKPSYVITLVGIITTIASLPALASDFYCPSASSIQEVAVGSSGMYTYKAISPDGKVWQEPSNHYKSPSSAITSFRQANTEGTTKGQIIGFVCSYNLKTTINSAFLFLQGDTSSFSVDTNASGNAWKNTFYQYVCDSTNSAACPFLA